MGRQWPVSVVNAQRALGALVGLMALATVLTVLLEDELIRSWAEHNDGASEILADGGMDALKASSISLPAFVPVVVVLFVVMVGMLGVLRVFFREGYEWARLSLAAVGLLVGLGAGLIAFRENPPFVFAALCVVFLVVDLGFLALLAHPDTTEFVRGSWLAHREPTSDTTGS